MKLSEYEEKFPFVPMELPSQLVTVARIRDFIERGLRCNQDPALILGRVMGLLETETQLQFWADEARR